MTLLKEHAQASERLHAKRWWILGVIGLASLMDVLDTTIINVALPSAQRDLGFSSDLRQWIVTAYALAFGSLLLVGGRLGDLFGRKWMFVVGAIGFALASAVGGAAPSFEVLVTARAVQGVFAALLAPSALGLLTTTFPEGKERSRAFAVYTAIVAGGAAVGLLLGGVLTQLLSWRYCLYINLIMAVPAAVGAIVLLAGEGRSRERSIDVPGTALACAGLFCLVFGFSYAETDSWSAVPTIATLVASAILLVAFVITESRVHSPLLPLRVVADRAHGGSYLAIAIAGTGQLGVFLFLTYFLQNTLQDSPIVTGLSFLPYAGALGVGIGATNLVLLPRLGARPPIVIGALLAAGGAAWLAQLTTTSSYAAGVLPGIVLMAVGTGMFMGAAIFTATYRIVTADAGVASAMVNTMQQAFGAVGTALLSTIFASALTSYVAGKPRSADVLSAAAVHGYTVAFWVSAGIFAGGAVVLALVLPRIRPTAAQIAASSAAGA